MQPTVQVQWECAHLVPIASGDDVLGIEQGLPKMIGSTIKKENLAALARSMPKITEVAMVESLREIPARLQQLEPNRR